MIERLPDNTRDEIVAVLRTQGRPDLAKVLGAPGPRDKRIDIYQYDRLEDLMQDVVVKTNQARAAVKKAKADPKMLPQLKNAAMLLHDAWVDAKVALNQLNKILEASDIQ